MEFSSENSAMKQSYCCQKFITTAILKSLACLCSIFLQGGKLLLHACRDGDLDLLKVLLKANVPTAARSNKVNSIGEACCCAYCLTDMLCFANARPLSQRVVVAG